MGVVIELFFIGIGLAIVFLILGMALGYVLVREYSKAIMKKWGVILVALSSILTFLIFTYGIGMRTCVGRYDLGDCVGAVMEVGLKMGVVLFPLIIIFGCLGLFTGQKLIKQPKATLVKKKKKS